MQGCRYHRDRYYAPMPHFDAKKKETRYVFALLLLSYLLGRAFQIYADKLPTLLIVVLHVLPLAIFALVHGAMVFRWRGILVFTFLCLGVASLFESLSLRTGFPFGHYYFTDLMGPKLFQLPILLALAYLGMGYLSWGVSLSILRLWNRPLAGTHIVLLPIVASFVMVAWDLSMDPVWANLEHAWVWKDGGPWFGVPISNFFGWFLTVYIFYQAFALYLRHRTPVPVSLEQWRIPILFYGASAAGNLLLAVSPWIPKTVTDASGKRWMGSDILGACVLVSVFVMGTFALIAWTALSSALRVDRRPVEAGRIKI
jgi:Carotenoid biosynthesis protein